MSAKRRDAAATAGVGVAGVAGGAALRHQSLERVYGEKGSSPTPRPRLWAERRFVTHRPGRGRYLAGAAAAFAGAPAAAVGVNNLVRRDVGKRSVVTTGFNGATDAFHERTESMKERPPKKLVAANYLSSLGVASGAGGITHATLSRHPRVPGGTRSALAASGAVLAGSLALPAQARATERASHGAYTTTPTGVRRAKAKPVKASAKATVVEGRGVPRGEFRRKTVGKAASDPGASLSRNQRRAIILASPPVPVIGDALQAGAAARLAPPGQRRRAAIDQGAATQGGGLAGHAAGAAGALAIARKSPGFDAKAQRANARIDDFSARARTKVGMKPAGRSTVTRVLESRHTPGSVTRGAARVASSRAGRAIAARPGVAAVGALVGGSIGSNLASNAAITRQLNRDDAHRAASSNRHGSVHKAEKPLVALSNREQVDLRRRKNRAAALSVGTGMMGIGALAANTGEKVAGKLGRRRLAGRLGKVPVPLLTASAGVGGYSSLNFAAIQHKEAASKAFGVPRLISTGTRRPGMRAGYVARRRSPGGTISTYTVRGGLT